jgi:putative FmdB family regulatory protein
MADSFSIMPTYEYQCAKCGGTFDVFQSMRDPALTTCPKEHCQAARWGRGRVSRMLGSGAGLIFKGSGFYITDYRSEGYKAAAKKDAPAAAEKSGGDSKKTDTKKSEPAKPAPAAPAKAAPKAKAA